mmetsp:Transcript_2682/g.6386  ORF Transcript_2682/g.6386 Transcript_2682/m.6386 type:complete len:206 (-) Transcript_2682:494-1111(-)
MSRDSFLTESQEQIDRLLHGLVLSCPSPIGKYFFQSYVMLKVKLIHELVVDRILEQLHGKRQFDSWCVDIQLDDDKIVWIELFQNRVQRIELVSILLIHTDIDPMIARHVLLGNHVIHVLWFGPCDLKCINVIKAKSKLFELIQKEHDRLMGTIKIKRRPHVNQNSSGRFLESSTHGFKVVHQIVHVHEVFMTMFTNPIAAHWWK